MVRHQLCIIIIIINASNLIQFKTFETANL